MAQGILRVTGTPKYRHPVVAANSEVFAEYSPVTVNASGFLAVASATGEKIFGFCLKAFTALDANQTGSGLQVHDAATARYAPPVLSPEGVQFYADADTDFDDTDAGAYADIASESNGVVTVDGAAGATGQFFVVGKLADIDPQFSEDDSYHVLEVAEDQRLGFSQD